MFKGGSSLKHDVGLFLFLVVGQIILSIISPESKWHIMWNNCTVDPWRTEYNPLLWRKALPWCETEDRMKRDTIASLMLSMKRNSPQDERIVAATNFGTNVQVYYMPAFDDFLINPEMIEMGGGTKWHPCGNQQPPMYMRIKVKYIDGSFRNVEKEFRVQDALAIQCEIFKQN